MFTWPEGRGEVVVMVGAEPMVNWNEPDPVTFALSVTTARAGAAATARQAKPRARREAAATCATCVRRATAPRCASWAGQEIDDDVAQARGPRGPDALARDYGRRRAPHNALVQTAVVRLGMPPVR
jgi:hypothetical protein